jgi:NadR type nicotinamide-nucleotide adenylyltransferase
MEKKSEGVKKIAVLGAESTGKTTLARSLALRFQTVWVPENAREYMNVNAGEYTLDDIETISREQLAQEKRLETSANGFLFVDTELIISKVWCMDVFGKCPEWIEKGISSTEYDLYLLTANDLPWVADPVRVNSQRRDYFFNWYKRELDNHSLPYEVITGRYEARLLSAINAIRKHFGHFE